MENIWKGQGKPKFALQLLNNPTGSGALDASKAAADKLGIDIVAVEEHATTTISEMESLTRIKGLNPDVLFISSTPAPTAVIIKNAHDLGMFPGMRYPVMEVTLNPGDLVVAYTDGVTEAVNWRGEEFEEAGLERVIRQDPSLPGDRLIEQVMKQVLDHVSS